MCLCILFVGGLPLIERQSFFTGKVGEKLMGLKSGHTEDTELYSLTRL